MRGPPVVMGYLNNPKATAETFVDGWLRTGDEAVIRKSAQGHEHVFVVDRIKELIKVKVRAVQYSIASSYSCGSLTCTGPSSRSRRAGGASPDASRSR